MAELIPIGVHKKEKNGGGGSGIGLPLKTVNFEFTGSKIFTLPEPAVNIVLVTVDNIPMNGTAGAPLQYQMNSSTELEILDEMIVGEDYWVSVTYNLNAQIPAKSIIIPVGEMLVFKVAPNENNNVKEPGDYCLRIIENTFIGGIYLNGEGDSLDDYDIKNQLEF